MIRDEDLNGFDGASTCRRCLDAAASAWSPYCEDCHREVEAFKRKKTGDLKGGR